MTPEEILSEALGILERDGWHQGHLVEYGPGGGGDTDDDRRYQHWQAMHNAPVCAIGALNRAAYGTANGIVPEWAWWMWGRAYDDVGQVAWQRLVDAAGCGEHIPEWNDAKSTSKEDVVLAFKRAIHG